MMKTVLRVVYFLLAISLVSWAVLEERILFSWWFFGDLDSEVDRVIAAGASDPASVSLIQSHTMVLRQKFWLSQILIAWLLGAVVAMAAIQTWFGVTPVLPRRNARPTEAKPLDPA